MAGTQSLAAHQVSHRAEARSLCTRADLHQLSRESSAVVLLHCFLKVDIEAGHAAWEEGVHHALRQVAAEVCLEECDQPGLARLPVKAKREPCQDPAPSGKQSSAWQKQPPQWSFCAAISASCPHMGTSHSAPGL